MHNAFKDTYFDCLNEKKNIKIDHFFISKNPREDATTLNEIKNYAVAVCGEAKMQKCRKYKITGPLTFRL